MAYFTRDSDAIVQKLLSFPSIAESSIQMFDCVSGDRGGFRILSLGDDAFKVSQVFSYATGRAVLVGTVSVLPNVDLAGGMFSSGCFCDRDPLEANAIFYRVDYV